MLSVLARQGERSLSIAPEAGNERLRRFINKKVTDAMLREKMAMIFAHGFTNLKLYLQIGLPSETDEDVRDLVALVADARDLALAAAKTTGKMATVIPSVNAFIPKPHTPYESEPLASEEELVEKTALLTREFSRMKNVRFRVPVGRHTLRVLSADGKRVFELPRAGAEPRGPRETVAEGFAPQIDVVVRAAPPPGTGKPVNPWDSRKR
jgi:radical SAM superfamily enzyme YgiQ (UPF0313 family)